MSLIIITP